MTTIKNLVWFFKVIYFCIKNGFKINPENFKNYSFCGPHFPLVVKQEQFVHGWRFVAKSKDGLIQFKFPAHYNIYDVRITLWNRGYKSIF